MSKPLLCVVAALLILLDGSGLAQNTSTSGVTFVGLSKYGIELSGDPRAPTIVNRSTKKVLGYVLKFADASGRGPVERILPLAAIHRGEATQIGIAPGAERKAVITHEVIPPGGVAPRMYTRVILDAVLFEDGELVGPDTFEAFESMSTRLKAERDLAKLLLDSRTGAPAQRDAAWSKIVQLSKNDTNNVNSGAPPFTNTLYNFTQSTLARDLLRARDTKGEAAAFDIAQKSSSLPTVWRNQ